MANPGFSERAFEFAFNAEYCLKNKGIVVGMPHIPSQTEEQWLGYDVAFELEPIAGQTCCLALQHKVSSFAATWAGRNKDFWVQMKHSSYFRFPLDVEQFNLLQHLSSLQLPGIEYRYSAPAFHTKGQLDAFYLNDTVVAHSVYIDIKKASPLSFDEPHNIIYSPSNPDAWVFSEPQRVDWSFEPPNFDGKTLDESSIDRIIDIAGGALMSSFERLGPSQRKMDELNALRNRYAMAEQAGERRYAQKLAVLGIVLGRYFGATLIAQKTK